jgi:hypothetical protein
LSTFPIVIASFNYRSTAPAAATVKNYTVAQWACPFVLHLLPPFFQIYILAPQIDFLEELNGAERLREIVADIMKPPLDEH